MAKRIAICLALCCFGTGCATARIQAPTLMPTSAYRFATEDQEVKVAADPYFTALQGKQTFGQDVAESEILPVWTVLDNQSEAAIALLREEAYLVSPGDKVYPAINPESIWPKLNQKREEITSGAAMYGVVGILTAMAMTAGEPKKLQQLVTETAWQETEIVPSERRAGFLYFDLPGVPKSLDGYRLRLNAVRKGQAAQLFEVALGGSRK